MELDDLKQVWQEQQSGPEAGKESLQALMLGKSKGPIARIRRNLNRELWVVLVLYVLTILFYIFVDQSRYWNVAIMLVVILALFIVYYYKKSRLLKEMDCVSGQVKATLERQIVLLERYIRFYFLSGTIGTPLVFFVTLFLLKSNMPQGIVLSEFFSWPMAAGMAVLVLVSYLLNKWYVNKLYGKHVEKLKELMRECGDVPMSEKPEARG